MVALVFYMYSWMVTLTPPKKPLRVNIYKLTVLMMMLLLLGKMDSS